MTKSMARWLLVFLFLLQGNNPAFADDSCVYAVTANDVPPNVVLLLDNGAEMEQIIWHSSYNNSVNYAVAGSVFTNSRGYAVAKQGSTYSLLPIQADLTPTSTGQIAAPVNNNPTWVINGRSITLPAVPSSANPVLPETIKDNAGAFRYSTNYLNWLFYSTGAGSYPDVSAVDNGTDLPAKTRFYYAKQAIFTMAKQTANKARIGINNFTSNTNGSSNVQPLGMVVNTPLAVLAEDNVLNSNFVNTVNNMGTITYSPLAEGVADIGTYYNSPSSRLEGVYCERNFVIVVTPGVSSADTPGGGSYSSGLPSTFSDYDGDNAAGGIGEGNIKKDLVTSVIPKNINGSTWLDDVAYYLATHDIVGYQEGFQSVNTYTVGFMSENEATRQFLINTSNNGNENLNLYDSNDPEYGKYHFEASSPEGLAQALMDALSAILEQTNAFSAPVVPVTRTTSGNRLYMAFFAPKANSNFWEGNVVKLGLDEDLNIVDQNGNSATFPNGAINFDVQPYWATIDWATPGKTNYISNSARNIYTYLGGDKNLTAVVNHFIDTNADLTATRLGNPTNTREDIINYVRGADVFDEDGDGNLSVPIENRALITGDVLHSEPLVHQYIHSTGTLTVNVTSGTFTDGEIVRGSKGAFASVVSTTGSTLTYNNLQVPFTADETLTGLDSGATATVSSISDITMVFFGSNDGMLHAVNDSTGTEAWGFIPPNQLSRLRLMIEGIGHQYYVDASPRIYLYEPDDPAHPEYQNGFIDPGDKVILVSGERKGSEGYFALDVTTPATPILLWRINRTSDLAYAEPDQVISQLGESWSVPRFGKVKTAVDDAVGTPVMIIGGGYSSTNATGKAVLAINVLTGATVRIFENASASIIGMNYSIPSTVRVLDTDHNGFIDKLYVGDMGGQIWRIGGLTDAFGTPLAFPAVNENILDWQGYKLFSTAAGRKFFYPPSVTLEEGYDQVYIGSGDRENPCDTNTQDEVYVIKDDHSIPAAWTISDLYDINSPPADTTTPKGWFQSLSLGEKVLDETLVFAGVLYFTTFTPNDDVCVPGGAAKFYTPEGSFVIGGGIPSRPVLVLRDDTAAILVSVGSTNPDDDSPVTTAGTVKPTNLPNAVKLLPIWWKEM